MPWDLTTPINTGDLDSSTYAQAKITRLMQDSNRGSLRVNIEYGNTVDGEWQRGKGAPSGKSPMANLDGAEYETLVDTAVPQVALSDPGDPNYVQVDVGGTPVWVEKTYVAVKRGIYEHLNSTGAIDAGSIS